jgi:hypothetical protein
MDTTPIGENKIPMQDQSYDNSTHNKSPDGGWFPVHVAHITDPALIRAEMKLGNEAIGLLVKTMAHLRLCPGYRDDIDNIPELAYKFRTDTAKLSSLICDYGLFQTEDGLFSCPWLSNSMYPLDEKLKRLSEAGRRGNRKRWGQPSPPDPNPIARTQHNSIEEDKTQEDSKNKKNILLCESFEVFWSIYDKKIDRKSAEKLWAALTDDERQKATAHATTYVKATPDKQFRKDPSTYLRNKSFENENIASGKNENGGDNSAGLRITPGVVGSGKPGTSAARLAVAKNW